MIEKSTEFISKLKVFRDVYFRSLSQKSEYSKPFKEVASFENGAQPPKSMHIYEKKEGFVRFIQNRDYESENHKTYIPISKRNHLTTEKDIMLDKYGEAGSVRYGLKGAFNVALLKVIPNDEIMREYIRDFLSQVEIKNVLYNSSQASTRPSLNENTFLGLKIPIINHENMMTYNEIMSSLLQIELHQKKLVLNLKEIKSKLLSKYF